MKYLFLLSSALAFSVPAMAQEAGEVTVADRVRDTLITVVGTGSAARVDLSGQPISVIGREEIDAVQGPDITRVLERLPGLTIARAGGIGSQTSLFVRGANSQQLLVMVDGIRVADVAAPSGGYDFGNLTTGGLGKIELLRGSNSVIWGSDAIGGVLALTSRDVNGLEASAEYGARDSFDGQVTGGVTGDGYGVTLNGGYLRTDGISQAASGTERDGFRQWRAGGRAHVDIAPGLTANIVGRYTQGKLDIDGFDFNPPFGLIDTPDYQKTREIGGRAGLAWTSEPLDLNAGYQISDTRRRYFGPSYFGDTANTQGQTRRAELFGAWRIMQDIRLDFGADHEWSRIETSGGRNKAGISSGHALLGWYGDRATLAGGVRYDDHSRFGGQWTFGANGSFTVVDQWHVRASYGEGFKVPTLYQLFSEYGNPLVDPERSRSYDAGIEYGDRNGPLHFALTGFRRDSRNLIDFAFCPDGNVLCNDGRFGYYQNIGRARATGFELELGAQVSERMRGQAAYTYVKATNRTAGDFNEGTDLARRPRHALTMSADWTSPLAGLVLGGDLRMVSGSYSSAGNFSALKGYATGTVRASLPINEHLDLFGRIENLTDEKYEVVSGYGVAGRSGFVGVRARL